MEPQKCNVDEENIIYGVGKSVNCIVWTTGKMRVKNGTSIFKVSVVEVIN